MGSASGPALFCQNGRLSAVEVYLSRSVSREKCIEKSIQRIRTIGPASEDGRATNDTYINSFSRPQ